MVADDYVREASMKPIWSLRSVRNMEQQNYETRDADDKYAGMDICLLGTCARPREITSSHNFIFQENGSSWIWLVYQRDFPGKHHPLVFPPLFHLFPSSLQVFYHTSYISFLRVFRRCLLFLTFSGRCSKLFSLYCRAIPQRNDVGSRQKSLISCIRSNFRSAMACDKRESILVYIRCIWAVWS